MRINDLGIDSFHEETIEWRHPWKEDFKSDILKGKKFRIGRNIHKAKTYLHTCIDSDWVSNKQSAVIKYKYGEIDAKATFFQLPMRKQKTTSEIKQEIAIKYPNSKLEIGQGCQLHGDIDAILTLEDGEIITIAWNY